MTELTRLDTRVLEHRISRRFGPRLGEAGYPFVQIVVLNWNGWADTMACVRSLLAQSYPNASILVVDNGSTTAPPEALRALSPAVELLLLPENLGYTGGNNVALKQAFDAGADYVWLFNNDAVADADTLSGLVALARSRPDAGLISPLVVDADNPDQVQIGCALLDMAGGDYAPTVDVAQTRTWLRDHPDRILLYGTALLMSRAAYEAIGGFDERFFAYCEDVDLSVRSAQAGFRNLVALDVQVRHEAKKTIADPTAVRPHYYYFMARNEVLLWRKLLTGRALLRANLWIFCRQLRQILRMPGHQAGVDAVLAGLWHGWRGEQGRYVPSRRMPNPLRSLLSARAGTVLRVLGAAG